MEKVEKYYPNKKFVNPEYVKSLFDQMIPSDKEKLIRELSGTPYDIIGDLDPYDVLDCFDEKTIKRYLDETY